MGRRRPKLAAMTRVLARSTALLRGALLVGAALWLAAGAPALAGGCVAIGPSIFCGAEAAHTVIGRSAIFRTGRPGEIAGGFLFLDRPGRPTLRQVLRREIRPRADPLPQAPRPGQYIDFQRGKDFGAFEFPLTNKLGGTIAGSRAGPLGPRLPPLK